jgi:uncharacterized protein (TIGR03382 family)
VEPKGGAFCCGATADMTPSGGLAALALFTLALLLRPRRVR